MVDGIPPGVFFAILHEVKRKFLHHGELDLLILAFAEGGDLQKLCPSGTCAKTELPMPCRARDGKSLAGLGRAAWADALLRLAGAEAVGSILRAMWRSVRYSGLCDRRAFQPRPLNLNACC
jgi:hypothetical protein